MNTQHKILVGILIYLVYLNLINTKEHYIDNQSILRWPQSYFGGSFRNTSIGSFFYGLFPYWSNPNTVATISSHNDFRHRKLSGVYYDQ